MNLSVSMIVVEEFWSFFDPFSFVHWGLWKFIYAQLSQGPGTAIVLKICWYGLDLCLLYCPISANL